MTHEMEDEKLGELLMQRATGALSGPEADALARALASMPAGEVARWEQAAAELTAAFAAEDADARQPMPAELTASLIATGERLVRAQKREASDVVTPITAARPNWLGWSGWLAAAAALVLWIATPRATPTVAPTPTPAPVQTVAMLRDSLLSSDSSVTRIDWTATKDSSALAASGDVVWSGRAQRGVMRIAGLQPNDRTRWQYQLWIFDKTRDEKYPVDGGVFDIPAGKTEVLVPIDARVPVGDAVLFAITVEKAGGVVVSTRERIALLAQRKA